MQVQVINTSGESTGRTVELSEAIFNIAPNDHAIYLDVKQYLANQRQGTHKAKERNEIAGSTRKLKRQKGTGTARAGSIKSPLFRGGGRVFGPRPRSYSFKLNRKLKSLARKSALTYKAKEAAIAVIEDFRFEQPSTKAYLNLLAQLQADQQKTLLITPETDNNLYLSGRNLKKAKVLPCAQLSTYEIINADRVFFLESAVAKIESLLNK
ncbi:50S ribosomal protein L4 [Eisenibacter elegans]|jgi:large subunit ribosomal protein L4|uniref:50S ribosomal protein L4 n=1 Tax=Eisenibacter elegans TaxID=997 RepID=UPI0003F5CA17|nr:50S ribosomal protein L4 [Eisenibacter elegans]